ncbi:hypothetical protein [Nocardioides sp. URHA0020]|uniref:hypothetical protein n=1 Tax=Nocardioides sp. URHA0020 TaxID=1380392 RepID=UPI00048D2937|nr:hypothetical protein [Nocardioides sp. URHA0020]
MSHRTPRRLRGGRGIGLILTLSLTATALAGTASALGADPAADCTQPFPVADLTPGDPVEGLTVLTGTTPTGFTGQVLGTLNDGIAPGVDMVLVKVDPAGLATDEVKGIWQGMSGSPVYAADGRLIGAIAYGLSTEQSWIAGVTPFEDMDDYLTAPALRVGLKPTIAAKVAAAAGVSKAQAARGFEQLPVPLAVSGVPSRFLHPSAATLAKHPWLRTDLYAAGRSSLGVSDGAETMVAGGNLAASLSYGDVLMAGVGTVTSVCGDKVVGFGHPMEFSGDSTLSLHPAEALYIQGDNPPFKVANIGAPVGTIFGDHMTGITGQFGALPSTATVTSKVTKGSRTRIGKSYVSARSSDNLATTTLLESSLNHALVVDGSAPGSEILRWKVSGVDADNRPFTLAWTDRVRATMDLASEASYYAASAAYEIADMEGVTVNDVVTVGDVVPNGRHYRLQRVEQLRSGKWSWLSESRPATAVHGKSIKLRAVLRSGSTTLRVPFTFAVPRSAAGKMAILDVTGGASTEVELGDTVATARKALSSAVRSDTVQAQFGQVEYYGYDGEDEEEFFRGVHKRDEPRMVKFLQTQTSKPSTSTMSGEQMAMVVIR